MIVNSEALDGLFKGYSLAFNKGLEAPETAWSKIAMLVPSNTASETYAWLGQAPRVREWIGERVVRGLAAYGYTIVNRKFEDTVSVQRTMIEDDQYGVYTPMMTELGRSTSSFPDELMFGLLQTGFTTPCFDGQNFFDTDHPINPADGGAPTLFSNVQLGVGPDLAPAPWFLMDTSRSIKPLVY